MQFLHKVFHFFSLLLVENVPGFESICLSFPLPNKITFHALVSHNVNAMVWSEAHLTSSFTREKSNYYYYYCRSYYRCTFRITQNCWATKQVQRSDEDPNLFEITYRGRHTCSHATNLVPAPSSPEKQEQKHNNNNNNDNQQKQSLDILSTIRNNLRVTTENLDNREMAHPFSFPSTSFGCMKSENSHFSLPELDNSTLLGGFPQPFLSQASPESNYFTASPFQVSNFGGVHMQFSNSESEIISAHTSATNSPILDIDFSLDPVEIDPNFPFDTPGFFS